MKTWTQLRDLTRQINKAEVREYRFPAISTNPPEAEGFNFNPSSAGTGAIGPRSEHRGNKQWGRMAKTKTEEIKISELLPNPYNRTLDRSKVDKIKQAIKTSGIIKPLVYTEIDHNGKPGKMVTDGHHRFVALKELGYKTVSVVMSDERGIETTANVNTEKGVPSWLSSAGYEIGHKLSSVGVKIRNIGRKQRNKAETFRQSMGTRAGKRRIAGKAARIAGISALPVVGYIAGKTSSKTSKRDKAIDKQFRIFRRFKPGQLVYYYDSNVSAFDEGKIVSRRVANNYQVLNTATHRNYLINGRQIRPRESRRRFNFNYF